MHIHAMHSIWPVAQEALGPYPETFMSTTAATDDSFQEDVLNSKKPVLVDFWAVWCGPCKQIAPTLEDISKEMGDKISVVKINIDENPLTPTNLNVRGIPTLMLFKNGKVASTRVGALPKGKIVEWIEETIES